MPFNPYEGSIPSMRGSNYANYVAGVSGYVPSEMTQDGWKFHDRSEHNRTIWQYMKTHENGRHDQIRFNNHGDYGEKAHLHIKIMLDEEEKPTREQFIHEIAPQLNRILSRSLKRDKKGNINNLSSPNAFGTTFPRKIKMMRICPHCESIIEVTPTNTCPICGKSLS